MFPSLYENSVQESMIIADPLTGRTHPSKDGRSCYSWLISVQVVSLIYIMLFFPTMTQNNISKIVPFSVIP